MLAAQEHGPEVDVLNPLPGGEVGVDRRPAGTTVCTAYAGSSPAGTGCGAVRIRAHWSRRSTDRPVGRKIIEEGHRQGLVVAGHLGRYSAQDAVSDGIDCLEHIWSVFDYIFPSGRRRLPDAASQQKLDAAELQ